jgi:hypothetical protein
LAGADSWVVVDCGACAGGFSELDELWVWWVEVSLECPVFAACAPEDLIVLPGKALAATAVSAPVKVTLPASSQRLVSTSLRSPASLALVEGGITQSLFPSERNLS